MGELFRRGWHPDPYGVHKERYFYADNQPGRLVRDEPRHEFYDDIPAGAPPFPAAPAALGADDEPLADVGRISGPLETIAASSAIVTARPVPPVQPVAVSSRPVFLPSESRWEDPEPGVWRRSLSRLGDLCTRHRVLAGLAILAAAALIVGSVVLLSGPSHTPSATATATSAADLRSGDAPANTPPSSTSAPGAVPSVAGSDKRGGSATTTTTTSPPVLGSAAAGAATAWTSTGALLHSSTNLASVSCSNGTLCFAVGETALGTGMVMASIDSGSTWHQAQLPVGVPPLAAVSCPTTLECLAVGETTLLTTTNFGGTWTPSTLGTGRLTAVTCLSSQVCLAASVVTPGRTHCQSGETYATANGGATWSSTQLSCFVPSAISCPSATFCVMAGLSTTASGQQRGAILSSSNTGRTWSEQYAASDTGSGLAGISCPSVRVCVAAGWGTATLLRTGDGGTTWQTQTPQYPLGPDRFYAVTCLTQNFCQVVGTAQPERTTDGSTWVTYPAPTGVRVLTGVTCPNTSVCIAVGSTEVGAGVTVSQAI